MKLSQFKIGDKVEWKDECEFEHITGEVGCIHENELYLKNLKIIKGSFDPFTCLRHRTRWLCEVKDDGEVGGDGSYGILKLIKPKKRKHGKRIKRQA